MSAPRVEWPARHELRSAFTAAFWGRAGAAARCLAERGVPGRPALFAPGRTLVVVAYQDFEASPVGPYRQVSVSLPVHLSARAPLLLPLLFQSLGSTERYFRDLYFHVAAIPVSAPAAVAYSGEIWGEPAWLADVEAAPGSLPGRLEVRVGDPGSPMAVFTLRGTTGGLAIHERRGYRLVSRLGPGLLEDVMRVEAPGRLGFGPGRATLELGDDPRCEALRDILGPAPSVIQTLAHGRGTVSFGGPSVVAPPVADQVAGRRATGQGGGTPLVR